jgi:hypothetical protein
MSLKITIVLSLLGLLLFGSVLSQTNTVNQQTDSNISTDTNRPSNVIKINPNRIQAIMSPDLQTETIDEIKSVACQYLTESDAANIFSKPMLYYTSSTFETELKCIYMPPKEFPLGITFEIKTYPTVKQAKARLKSLVKISKEVNRQVRLKEFPKARLPNPKFIAGIGQSAYFATGGDNYEYVFFQKNKTIFEITVLGKTGSHFDENVLKSVAKIIAENFESRKK